MGCGDSVAFVEAASVWAVRSTAASVAGAAAVTVTEAAGVVVVEMGRTGATA